MCPEVKKRKRYLGEIIVTLIFIAILVALFWPVYHDGRKGYSTQCLSILKQLATGFQMAAQDDRDRLPAADEWTKKIAVQGDRVFCCPSSKHQGTRSAPDYLYVAALIHNQHSLLSHRILGDVHDPSGAAMLVELVDPGKAGQTSYVSDAIETSPGKYAYDPKVALYDKIDRTRHNNGSNIAFVDGHVAYLKADKLNFGLLMNSMTPTEPLSKAVVTGSLFSNELTTCADPYGTDPKIPDGACSKEVLDYFTTDEGHFIVIGRPKAIFDGTVGAIITANNKVVQFLFTAGGKTFPKNAQLPGWWDYSDPANQPRWEGDGPSSIGYHYTYAGCIGLFGGDGERRITTSLVFKAKVPHNINKRIIMLNTCNGKYTTGALNILGIEQTDTAGVTENLHITDIGERIGKDENNLHDGWTMARGVLLPLKNGYTYKITYRFELINGLVFPCFEL